MRFVTRMVTNLKVKYFPVKAEIYVVFCTFALAAHATTLKSVRFGQMSHLNVVYIMEINYQPLSFSQNFYVTSYSRRNVVMNALQQLCLLTASLRIGLKRDISESHSHMAHDQQSNFKYLMKTVIHVITVIIINTIITARNFIYKTYYINILPTLTHANFRSLQQLSQSKYLSMVKENEELLQCSHTV